MHPSMYCSYHTISKEGRTESPKDFSFCLKLEGAGLPGCQGKFESALILHSSTTALHLEYVSFLLFWHRFAIVKTTSSTMVHFSGPPLNVAALTSEPEGEAGTLVAGDAGRLLLSGRSNERSLLAESRAFFFFSASRSRGSELE